MKRITWVLVSSFCAFSVNAQPLTLSTLKAKLSKSANRWEAGETKMSKLSPQEQKMMLGANLPDSSEYFFAPNEKKSYATTSWDWRNQGGKNYASPILNQANCGSCVAFAAIGQLETQMNITRKTTNSPWVFSPQHLFSCGGGYCEKGWTPMSALSFLQTEGVPDESCFPYTSGAYGDDLSCSSTCSDAASRSTKITGYRTTSFFFFSGSMLKKALKKGPLMTTLDVYEDFMFYKGGVYEHTSGEKLGGHAVVLEGWDDSTNSWLVRNSWGEDWGENGYFRISMDDISGVGRMSWSIEVPDSADGYVNLGSLRDRAVLTSAKQPIEVTSTFADTKNVKWQLMDGTKTQAEGTAVSRSTTVEMDTTTIPDGVYQLVAVAERASTTVKSAPRDVYVLNGKLTGDLKFTSIKTGDTLSGEIALQADVSSSPVPFSKVTFRSKNTATGEVIERSTNSVGAKIGFMLRSKARANGDWELSLIGEAGTQTVTSPVVKVTIKN